MYVCIHFIICIPVGICVFAGKGHVAVAHNWMLHWEPFNKRPPVNHILYSITTSRIQDKWKQSQYTCKTVSRGMDDKHTGANKNVLVWAFAALLCWRIGHCAWEDSSISYRATCSVACIVSINYPCQQTPHVEYHRNCHHHKLPHQHTHSLSGSKCVCVWEGLIWWHTFPS